MCSRCPAGSIPRERALMLILERLRPNWRWLHIHESSPVVRGVSLLLAHECPKYVPIQFFPGVPGGAMYRGFRCEDIEAQTFDNGSFDLVITEDVMEHVLHPDRAYREIYRALRSGGLHLHTVPIYSEMEKTETCAVLAEDGGIIHLSTPPEYHGNPIDESGALVTPRYGRDLPDMISEWAPFSVEVTDLTTGVDFGAFGPVEVEQLRRPAPITSD